MLVSTFKQPLETPSTPTFADVAEDRWSYPYVEVCREFLTGYANPFGGLPTFHPTEYATREDIAVALVRMMGFTDSDASDKNYAGRKFYDGNSISPSLMPYVSIACERGLISGYPDGSFGPTQGITRAETVVLLNRATKQAVTNINAELELSANIIYSSDGKTATINISAEEGTTVTVNGETVKMSSNYYDEYEGNYVYKFESEGTKDFVIEGKRSGKTKTINLTAKYEIGAPKLNITQCPATSEYKTITIKGKATDTNDSQPVVTINGKDVGAYYGSFEKSFTLTEGDNKFTIVATNNLGKSTTVEKTVTFGVDAPKLNITQCPTTSEYKTITIKGKATDTNDSQPVVTINGKDVGAYYGSFEKSFTLTEGDNKFTIVATNNLGKSTTVEKTVTFGVDAPKLNITQCPATSEYKTITIKGKATDTNDSQPVVTINGKDVGAYYGSFEKSFTLTEGDNKFTIVATNNLGKSTTVEKTVTFSVGTPEISFTNCPEVTQQKNLSIQGRIKGQDDGAKLYINDQEVSVGYSGDFSKSVTLSEGDNSFVFRAVNSYGKSKTISKTIKYVGEIKAPVLKVDDIASSTAESKITIAGTVDDSLDSKVVVYVNDKKITSGNGNWTADVSLDEGDNDIIVVATNSYGKSTTIVKKVTYTAPVSTDE